MPLSSKQKAIFGIIVLLLIVLILFFIFRNSNTSNNDDDINTDNDSDVSREVTEEDKKITAGTKSINPNNYESLDEFLGYYNNSGIDFGLDLLEDTFYIRVPDGKNFIITRFDESLKKYIDETNQVSVKNDAINDIFNSYQDEHFIIQEGGEGKSGLRIVEEHELPENYQFNNMILSPFLGQTFIETKNELSTKEQKTGDEFKQLAYIHDLEGDYEMANSYKRSMGEPTIRYTITGKVLLDGNALSGATVKLLNYSLETTTDSSGEYSFEFDTYELTRIRLRANYEGVSDGYNGVYVVLNHSEQSSKNVDFVLHKYDSKFTINPEDISNGKTKVITSTWGNSFEFEEGKVVDRDGNVYNGVFEAMIFEFDRSTPTSMESLLALDNFDTVYGYVGEFMITYGMTYLSLRDMEGNELFISKKNQVKTTQILDIDLMMQDAPGGGISPMTQEQFDLILAKSREEGYPIDRLFLENRQISGFAPFWVLNGTRGVWEAQGVKVIKVASDYVMESLYYNVD